jgi:hypothetical protein
MKLPLKNSSGLPPPNCYIYVEWDEIDSDEPAGWYHCYVSSYCSDSHVNIVYHNNTTEKVDLNSVRWEFARKNSKPYLPINTTPPVYPLKKQRAAATDLKYTWSEDQRVKAYADDLTYLSVSKDDHQLALTAISQSCQELDLEIRPDKCVTYCFDGQKPLPRMYFSLINGNTSNISTAPTKFLGETIGITLNTSKRLSAKKLSSKLFEIVNKIDIRPIRGEYKVWIYKCYLIPSVLFNLTVDKISMAATNKVQSRMASYLKKWLKLPRCATLSSLFHPDVLNLPYLPHQLEKAKLRFLATISMSSNLNINSLASLINDPQSLMNRFLLAL